MPVLQRKEMTQKKELFIVISVITFGPPGRRVEQRQHPAARGAVLPIWSRAKRVRCPRLGMGKHGEQTEQA